MKLIKEIIGCYSEKYGQFYCNQCEGVNKEDCLLNQNKAIPEYQLVCDREGSCIGRINGECVNCEVWN